MKLDPSAPSINIKSISRQTESFNQSAKMRNQANTAFYKASGEQKPAATIQLNQAKKSAESRHMATYNQRINTVKETTAKLNQVTKEKGTEANVMMAKVISPPGSKLQPQQLGRFIDQYA